MHIIEELNLILCLWYLVRLLREVLKLPQRSVEMAPVLFSILTGETVIQLSLLLLGLLI